MEHKGQDMGEAGKVPGTLSSRRYAPQCHRNIMKLHFIDGGRGLEGGNALLEDAGGVCGRAGTRTPVCHPQTAGPLFLLFDA